MNNTQQPCRPVQRRQQRTHIHGRSVCRALIARSQWFANSRRKVAPR